MTDTTHPPLVAPRDATPPEVTGLPAEIAPGGELLPIVPSSAAMPLGLRIFFDPHWRAACEAAAVKLSKAIGFAPPHLIGKTESCLAVVNLALTWNLSPYMVAACTYQTPGGKVGYEGKLVHAILEASGRLNGAIKYAHYGDWSRVQRKFAIKEGERGHKYAVPTYKAEDEVGLGVTITCRLKGESEDRRLDFDLVQAWPRNSTLWATDPKTQLQYAGVRRLANTVMPGTIMGVQFDAEDEDWADSLIDVTPPNSESDKVASTSPPTAPPPRRGRPPTLAQPRPNNAPASGAVAAKSDPAAETNPETAPDRSRENSPGGVPARSAPESAPAPRRSVNFDV